MSLKLKTFLLTAIFVFIGLFPFSSGYSQESKPKSKTLGNADFGASETPKKKDDYSFSPTEELLKMEAETRPRYNIFNRESIRNGIKTTVVGRFIDEYKSVDLQISYYPDSPFVALVANAQNDHVLFVLSPSVLSKFLGLLDKAINHESNVKETNTVVDHADSAIVDITADDGKQMSLFFKDTSRKEAFFLITKDSAKVLKEFLLTASPYQAKETPKTKSKSKGSR